MTIEERMVEARGRLGLHQKDVAAEAGVSRATVSRAEAGVSRLSGTSRDRIEAWLERRSPALDEDAQRRLDQETQADERLHIERDLEP